MYERYYFLIQAQKNNLTKIIERLNSSINVNDKLKLAKIATEYALNHNTGYYFSPSIEKFYCELGSSFKTDLAGIMYTPNSFLHVMTQGYLSGGHTRVVERWIEQSEEYQKQSVIFTVGQEYSLPRLEKAINKKGEIFVIDKNLKLKEKIDYLRKIASEYEFIVLHVHMNDPLPLIAFSCENFERPVLFYNHASHQFWLGKSIADVVLDIEENDIVTCKYRGVANNAFLGVPTYAEVHNKSKEEVIALRKKLNLPVNKNIIMTAGSDAKYHPICGASYKDFFAELNNGDNFFVVIGVNPDTSFWRGIKRLIGSHIIIKKPIQFGQAFLDYMKAADLFLDSYPVCGGTVVIDAISVGTTALSLRSAYPQFDYLRKSTAYCNDVQEFYTKIKLALYDSKYRNSLYEELVQSLNRYQAKDVWKNRLNKILENVPKIHNIDEKFCAVYSEPTDLSVMCNVLANPFFCNLKYVYEYNEQDLSDMMCFGSLYKHRKIFKCLELKKFKTEVSKTTIVSLFGKRIFMKTKAR